MSKFGLNEETIKDRLKENGVTDEVLVEAIVAVIVENNKEIEKNVTNKVSADFMAGLKSKGFR